MSLGFVVHEFLDQHRQNYSHLSPDHLKHWFFHIVALFTLNPLQLSYRWCSCIITCLPSSSLPKPHTCWDAQILGAQIIHDGGHSADTIGDTRIDPVLVAVHSWSDWALLGHCSNLFIVLYIVLYILLYIFPFTPALTCPPHPFKTTLLRHNGYTINLKYLKCTILWVLTCICISIYMNEVITKMKITFSSPSCNTSLPPSSPDNYKSASHRYWLAYIF